jgi:hypothetical protein
VAATVAVAVGGGDSPPRGDGGCGGGGGGGGAIGTNHATPIGPCPAHGKGSLSVELSLLTSRCACRMPRCGLLMLELSWPPALEVRWRCVHRG